MNNLQPDTVLVHVWYLSGWFLVRWKYTNGGETTLSVYIHSGYYQYATGWRLEINKKTLYNWDDNNISSLLGMIITDYFFPQGVDTTLSLSYYIYIPIEYLQGCALYSIDSSLVASTKEVLLRRHSILGKEVALQDFSPLTRGNLSKSENPPATRGIFHCQNCRECHVWANQRLLESYG